MAFFKPYSLGTMMMAWRLDKTQAREIVAAALDHDITLMDTSVSYARGACHAMLADVIQTLGCAQKVQVASKVGGVSSDSDPEHFKGLSAFNIARQCDLSLQQLGVEALDLLQLHFYDSQIPLEEQVQAMQKLQQQGKIKAWGVCNYTAAQFQQLYTCATALGGALPISNQVQFNLIDTSAAQELPAVLQATHAESMVWGPLSSGLLSNTTAQHMAFDPKSRIGSGREKDSKLALLSQERTQKLLQALLAASQKTGASVSQLAIAWVSQQTWVNTVLLGPSSLEQFKELLAIPRLGLDPELLHRFSKIE